MDLNPLAISDDEDIILNLWVLLMTLFFFICSLRIKVAEFPKTKQKQKTKMLYNELEVSIEK